MPGLKGKQRQYDHIRLEDRPIFARLCAIRQFLEQVKARVIMTLLAELDIKDKVILFCEFKEPVSSLRELCEATGYGCVTRVGSDSLIKRQKAIDKFQADPDTRVLIGTTSASGTGNHLPAANYVMFLGLPLTLGLQDQVKDLAYRARQLRLVAVKIPLVENTVDQKLWKMLTD